MGSSDARLRARKLCGSAPFAGASTAAPSILPTHIASTIFFKKNIIVRGVVDVTFVVRIQLEFPQLERIDEWLPVSSWPAIEEIYIQFRVAFDYYFFAATVFFFLVSVVKWASLSSGVGSSFGVA